MKLYVIMIGVIAIATGCKSQNGASQQAINDNPSKVTLPFGDTLRFDLGFFGDEDKARILHQPSFNVFDGFCSDNREPLVYCYAARSWFAGRDTVTFKISRGSDGSNPSPDHEIKQLIIKLTQK